MPDFTFLRGNRFGRVLHVSFGGKYMLLFQARSISRFSFTLRRRCGNRCELPRCGALREIRCLRAFPLRGFTAGRTVGRDSAEVRNLGPARWSGRSPMENGDGPAMPTLLLTAAISVEACHSFSFSAFTLASMPRGEGAKSLNISSGDIRFCGVTLRFPVRRTELLNGSYSRDALLGR